MSRWTLAAALAAATLALGAADAAAWDFTIDAFDAELDLRPDGDLEVAETITVRFLAPRHGIYREIPVRYEVGAHQYALRFRLLGVEDGEGRARPTETSHRRNYVHLRIGDPDRTVQGVQVYRIRYRVGRAVLFRDDHCVLRWNATGTEWPAPITRASVVVRLPRAMKDEEIRFAVWTGFYGSHATDARVSRPDASTLATVAGPLLPRQGVSLDLTMPPDAVAPPPLLRRLGWWAGDNFAYFLVPLTLLLCLVAWYRRGRDAPGRGTIVVRYEPPEGFGPAELGTLVDERVDVHDISATIIDLAARGYLRIVELEDDDYRFVRGKEPDGLKPYERWIWDEIFDKGKRDRRRLSQLQHRFYARIPEISTHLYTWLVKQKYLDGNPEKVRSRFFRAGGALLALAVAAAVVLQLALVGRVFGIPLAVAATLSGIVLAVTARRMPRKTRKGRIAWEEIAGLEEYIRRAEVPTLAEQERRKVFERLLPHAIALRLAGTWASAFKDLYTEPPQWFQALTLGPFSTYALVRSVSRSVSCMDRTLPAPPRSEGRSAGGGWTGGGFGGGGFSGGGFGGGGGGSW